MFVTRSMISSNLQLASKTIPTTETSQIGKIRTRLLPKARCLIPRTLRDNSLRNRLTTNILLIVLRDGCVLIDVNGYFEENIIVCVLSVRLVLLYFVCNVLLSIYIFSVGVTCPGLNVTIHALILNFDTH